MLFFRPAAGVRAALSVRLLEVTDLGRRTAAAFAANRFLRDLEWSKCVRTKPCVASAVQPCLELVLASVLLPASSAKAAPVRANFEKLRCARAVKLDKLSSFARLWLLGARKDRQVKKS